MIFIGKKFFFLVQNLFLFLLFLQLLYSQFLFKTLNFFSSRRYLLKYSILMCHSLKQTNFSLKCINFLFFIIKLIKYLVYLFNLLIIVYCNINLQSNFWNLISIVCGFRVIYINISDYNVNNLIKINSSKFKKTLEYYIT